MNANGLKAFILPDNLPVTFHESEKVSHHLIFKLYLRKHDDVDVVTNDR